MITEADLFNNTQSLMYFPNHPLRWKEVVLSYNHVLNEIKYGNDLRIDGLNLTLSEQVLIPLLNWLV